LAALRLLRIALSIQAFAEGEFLGGAGLLDFPSGGQFLAPYHDPDRSALRTSQ
jgi:hypothetical protein